MTIKRGVIYASCAAVALCALWFVRHRRDKKIDADIKSTILPPGDNDKIIVDPRRHTIQVVSKKGVTATFLPRTGGAIDVRKDGTVSVTTRKSGTETSVYLGGAFGSDIRLRAALGLNLYYLARWEVGPGLMINSDVKDTRLYIGVTYNVYDSYLVGVAVDHKKTAYLLAALKF